MNPTSPSKGPSKQFLIRGGVALAVLTIILILQSQWFKGLFTKKPIVLSANTTVGDLINKDSNNNGIADWEEKLWGLDPTVLYTNGKPNKQIIEEKKKALGVDDSQVLNDTDALARNVFTVTAAISSETDASNTDFNNAGQNLSSTIQPLQLPGKYRLIDVHTVKTSTASLKTYSKNINMIFASTSLANNTGEIDNLVNTVQNGDAIAAQQLVVMSSTYTTLASKLIKVPVPVGAAEYHLALVNNLYSIGQSLIEAAKINDDQLHGLLGVAAYKTYTDAADTAYQKLNDYLSRYTIS